MPTPNQKAAQMDGIYMDQPVIYKHSTCYPIVNIGEVNYGEPRKHRESYSSPAGATQISKPADDSDHAEIIKQHEEMMKMLANLQNQKMSGLSGDTPDATYSMKSLIILGIGALAFGFVASKLFFGRK
jgi:hypothetical protein